MLRYLGLIWNVARSESSTAAAEMRLRLKERFPEWSCVLGAPGLSLFISPSPFDCYRTHMLENRGGLVLGVLFDRCDPLQSNARATSTLVSNKSREILESRGRYLIDAFWGRYVAFIGDSRSGSWSVLRDPMGDIQCYHAHISGVDVYFSSLEDLLRIEGVRLTINWQHLTLRVLTGNAWADESALNEVDCVHPGECVEHRDDQTSREYYWHPFLSARQSDMDQLDVAAEELRATTRMCARSWMSLHSHVLHILSGGLDSSIVLSCIAPPSSGRVDCLNFRTRDPESDERVYARLAAEHAKCELLELEREPLVALDMLSDCKLTAGPLHLVMRGLEVQPLIAKVARARHATAVFSGDGGDIAFFRGWPELAVIDYARGRGVDKGLLSLALRASRPAQLSIWRLLGDAMRYGIFRKPWDFQEVIRDHYRLVSDEVIAASRGKLGLLNPWGLPIAALPPGKLLHAYSITRPGLFRDPLGVEPPLDFINPLLSQPVVELCLRIPTWVHAWAARDRAVAREAFAGDLPSPITRREWKGSADRHLQDLLSRNLNWVRELLLDGELVKAGILNRKRLENALSPGFVASMSYATEVFGYVCTEAWVRRWVVGPAGQCGTPSRVVGARAIARG